MCEYGLQFLSLVGSDSSVSTQGDDGTFKSFQPKAHPKGIAPMPKQHLKPYSSYL